VIALLDYGMGNLRSVEKAFERVGAQPARTDDLAVAADADGIVLPGVGAFPEAMRRIRANGMADLVASRAAEGVPVLGICLGLQLLFGRTDELGGATGLELMAGPVTSLDARGAKVPHIGWAPVRWEKESPLTAGLADEEPFYFVHSYVPRPATAADALGSAEYGERFVCAAERGNVFGVQFHPEKSSAAGLRLLRNFAEICVPAAAHA
jgi:imidazole glycerol-phosphate synthase subunit HisH